MSDPLTITETDELQNCEAKIERGFKTFVEVGNALMDIRDKRLYREAYNTFEDYCRGRWGIVASRARQLIAAAETVKNLESVTYVTPQNEAQVRPLVSLPPEQQREAWGRAVETSPDHDPSGPHVKQVVHEMRATQPYPNPEPKIARSVDSSASYTTGQPPPTRMSQELQVLLSHESTEWYTPAEYIEAARQVMGGIDLDPATSAIPQKWIKATVFYTISDNGLVLPWQGRVWLNPPYSKTEGQSNQELWSQKLIDEYLAGRVAEGILLVKASIGYNWFDRLFDTYPVCFVRGLINFIRSDGQPGGPAKLGSAFFYLGQNQARFASVFGDLGRVVTPERLNRAVG